MFFEFIFFSKLKASFSKKGI